MIWIKVISVGKEYVWWQFNGENEQLHSKHVKLWILEWLFSSICILFVRQLKKQKLNELEQKQPSQRISEFERNKEHFNWQEEQLEEQQEVQGEGGEGQQEQQEVQGGGGEGGEEFVWNIKKLNENKFKINLKQFVNEIIGK